MKRTCHLMNFGCPSRPLSEIERRWKDRHILGPCHRDIKAVELESEGKTNHCELGMVPRDLKKELEVLESRRRIETTQTKA